MTRAAVSRPQYVTNTNRRSPNNLVCRTVTNSIGSTNKGYSALLKFPAATPNIVLSDQQIVVTLDAAIRQCFSSFTQNMVSGESYIFSMRVIAKTGTAGALNNFSMHTVTATGTTYANDLAVGRHAFRFTCTSTGVAIIRFGLGTWGAEAGTDARTITIKDIMLERVGTRTTPYEYVNISDSRAFNYTYTANQTGTLITSETVGASYSIANSSSVLVIGDSMTDDGPDNAAWFGDFPAQMMDVLQGRAGISYYGVSGETIAQSTSRLVIAMANNYADSRAYPWKICICEGGTNDVNGSRTLVQMQTDQLARLAMVASYGLKPICCGVPPNNNFDSTKNGVLDVYNAWLLAYCASNSIPHYDVFTHSANGHAWKADWATLDGIHPGGAYHGGSWIWAQKMAALLSLV